MTDDVITIKIPTAREKLQVNFPQDPKGDLRLVFKSRNFNVQKAYLRLESGYFKKMCTPSTNILQIKQNFQEQYFSKIMNCFYGASIMADRLDLPNYYPIIRFLEIDSLINIVRKDILQYIQHYDLFVVMKIAHQYSDQQLFQICLQQLQKQSFEQLKYHQFQLLQTQLPLFKLIIKTHSRYRANGGSSITFIEIDQMLKDYCQSWGLGEDKYHELKFELIDKTALTSEQYKTIFLDEVIKYKNKTSMILEKNGMNQKQNLSGGLNRLMTNNLAESVLTPNNNLMTPLGNTQVSSSSSPNIAIANQLTLEMQNTFQKKRNQELRAQNRFLSEGLQNIKSMTARNQDIHEQMESQLKLLKEELKKKQQQQQEHRKIISKFEVIINKMQRELEEKNQAIDRLAEQFEDLKNRRPMSDDGMEDPEPAFVQSQFLPAHLIGEMMSEAKKTVKNQKPKPKENQKSLDETSQKLQQSLDQEQIQALYMNRLNFDDEPVSAPKIYLPRVAQFLSSEGFNKKILTLIYRRSLQHSSKGVNSDIRDKNSLLIIMATTTGQVVGGFVSVQIPKNQTDYLKDNGAFIFSLSKNHKFCVKKNEQNQAIFLSDQYLISFGNDLMIASDCLKEKSYSSWPSCYEGMKSSKQRGSVWLVGGEDSHFQVKSIDIYEIKEDDMQMMIID